MDEHVDRRVRNELLFRAANEKLRSLNVAFERFADEHALFVCECSRTECIEHIELAVSRFDGICASPDRYLVVPGHETLEVERVVSREPAYFVVERSAAVSAGGNPRQ
jgi:hypothetical protein